MNALNDFQKEILAGIPDELPEVKPYDPNINHAPKRKDILTWAEPLSRMDMRLPRDDGTIIL